MHRITELLEEAESSMPDKQSVEKRLNGKDVLIGGTHKAGYTCKGSWVWTSFSVERYPQDFRDMAKAYAEDD